MNIERYINIARSNILKATLREKHFTFLMRKSKIITIGINNGTPHPKGYHYGYKFGDIHSEVSAIMKYGESDCSDCYIINVRINRQGKVRMSKPCKTCTNVLKMFKIKKVFYSTSDSNIAEKIKII